MSMLPETSFAHLQQLTANEFQYMSRILYTSNHLQRLLHLHTLLCHWRCMSAGTCCTYDGTSSLSEDPRLMLALIVSVQKGFRFKIALGTCMSHEVCHRAEAHCSRLPCLFCLSNSRYTTQCSWASCQIHRAERVLNDCWQCSHAGWSVRTVCMQCKMSRSSVQN